MAAAWGIVAPRPTSHSLSLDLQVRLPAAVPRAEELSPRADTERQRRRRSSTPQMRRWASEPVDAPASGVGNAGDEYMEAQLTDRFAQAEADGALPAIAVTQSADAFLRAAAAVEIVPAPPSGPRAMLRRTSFDADASQLPREVNFEPQDSRRSVAMMKSRSIESLGNTRGGRCRRCGERHPDDVCLDLQAFLRRLVVPKYTNGLPEVEVSLHLYGVSELDVKNKCFSAELAVVLNWMDPHLLRDAHYTEDYQTHSLKLFPAIEPLIFNPPIIIDNSKEELELLSGSDLLPRIHLEVPGGLWMRRRLLYRGRFACTQESHKSFPVDGHALPVRIKAQPWGTHGTAKLRHPKGWNGTSRNSFDCGCSHDIQGHCFHLGDLDFFGFGVRSVRDVAALDGVGARRPDVADGSTYEVLLFVRRRVARHLFTFFILSLMVLSGATSFLCTLSVDGLAGRLSINVTVLLSMVAFCTQRPFAIESVPYNTMYDSYAQFCTCMTALLTFANVATFLNCFEVTDQCDDCIRRDRRRCEQSWCGSMEIDCIFVLSSVGIMLFYNVYVALRSLRYRWLELRRWRTACGEGASVGPRQWEPLFALASRAARRAARRDAVRGDSFLSNAAVAAKPQDRQRRREFSPTECSDWGGEAHFLDMGDGELGYYVYRLERYPGHKPQELVYSLSSGNKASVPALVDTDVHGVGEDGAGRSGKEQVAEAWGRRLALMLDHVVRYLQVEVAAAKRGQVGLPMPLDKPSSTLYIGITGHLAVTAQTNDLVADRLEHFVEDLELLWAKTCGQHWDVRYFVLSKNHEAIFERVAVSWLLANCNMSLSQGLRRSSDLSDYVQQQLSSWALLGGKRYGELDQEEFVEKMMGLSAESTLEHRVMDALDWFRQLDVDGRKSVTVTEVVGFILSSESLLRAVVCRRLFAGTLAGSTSLIQLTVRDAEDEGKVSVHSCNIGNGTPSLQNIFPDMMAARPQHITLWKDLLEGVLRGAGREVDMEPASSSSLAADLGETATEAPVLLRKLPSRSSVHFGVGDAHSTGLTGDAAHTRATQDGAWPSGLRGVFVGISSMFYAAEVCGIQERLIRKQHVVQALSSAIQAELKTGSCDTADERALRAQHRRVANLVMAHSMVSHVAHDDAWLYFRRKWKTSDDRQFVATWSLGLFLSTTRQGAMNDPALALARAASVREAPSDDGSSEPDMSGCTDADWSNSRYPGAGGGWRRRLSRAFGDRGKNGSSMWEDPD